MRNLSNDGLPGICHGIVTAVSVDLDKRLTCMHELSSVNKIAAHLPDIRGESILIADARRRIVSYGLAMARRI